MKISYTAVTKIHLTLAHFYVERGDMLTFDPANKNNLTVTRAGAIVKTCQFTQLGLNAMKKANMIVENADDAAAPLPPQHKPVAVAATATSSNTVAIPVNEIKKSGKSLKDDLHWAYWNDAEGFAWKVLTVEGDGKETLVAYGRTANEPEAGHAVEVAFAAYRKAAEKAATQAEEAAAEAAEVAAEAERFAAAKEAAAKAEAANEVNAAEDQKVFDLLDAVAAADTTNESEPESSTPGETTDPEVTEAPADEQEAADESEDDAADEATETEADADTEGSEVEPKTANTDAEGAASPQTAKPNANKQQQQSKKKNRR